MEAHARRRGCCGTAAVGAHRQMGKALSVLPTDELTQLAQGWSSFTELVKPSAQRAIDIQQEEKR
jgi:hypothetical protein